MQNKEKQIILIIKVLCCILLVGVFLFSINKIGELALKNMLIVFLNINTPTGFMNRIFLFFFFIEFRDIITRGEEK